MNLFKSSKDISIEDFQKILYNGFYYKRNNKIYPNHYKIRLVTLAIR